MIRSVVALSIGVVLCFGACSGGDAGNTIADIMERTEDPKQREEALRELGKSGDPAAQPVLLKWFDEPGRWQPSAAYALGELGDKGVSPQLVAGIDYAVGTGSDKRTRWRNRKNLNIARAMALLGADDEATVEALVRLLKVPDLSTREGVLRALGILGNHLATEAIVGVAKKSSHPFIRKVAIMALGDLGDPSAVGTLIQGLFIELPGTSFYYEARQSLIQIGEPAVEPLLKAFRRQDPAVEAIRLPSGMAIAEAAVEGKTAFVLGALKAPAAVVPIASTLERLLRQLSSQSSDSAVFASLPGAIVEMSFALGMLGDERGASSLLKVAKSDDANMRGAATEALVTLGARGAAAKLLPLCNSGSAGAKRAAIKAVGLLGGDAEAVAITALKDADSVALTNAKQQLVAAKACGDDLSCWTAKLGDKIAPVRERAAYELGWRSAGSVGNDAASRTGTVASLVKAAEDDNASVRVAAIASLDLLSKQSDTHLATLAASAEKWSAKIEYKAANAAIDRLLARLAYKG